MGLSNYIPSSRLSQAGVCTSSTRPASPYEGQMIYETDTNRVLVYDASAWVMIADTDTPPALNHITSVSFTNTTTINVDGCFSSQFKNYKVFVSLKPNATATGGVDFQLRASSSNISAVSYVWQGVNQNSTGSPSANNGSATTGWYLTNFYTATDGSSISEATIFNPNESAWTGYLCNTVFDWVGPQYYSRTQNGFYPATTVADGFRLVPTVAITGNIRVYGLRD